MNLAQKLKQQSLEIQTTTNKNVCLSIVRIVKNRAANYANKGETDLAINLASQGWNIAQAKLAIKELSEDGFQCRIFYNESSYHSANELRVSWDV